MPDTANEAEPKPNAPTPADAHDADAPGPDVAGQEDVEDRPVVSTVTPEDYPAADRADSRP